jgi:hypothetical protein
MWIAFTFIGYLAAALLIPVCLALVPVWRRTRTVQQVTCPAVGTSTMIALDPWYAVRMHALGNRELRIKSCTRWPGRRDCGRDCLFQIGPSRV